MLSIAALGGNLHYYLYLANVEYFHDGGEPPGQWFGRGATALGLKGTADKKAVKNLAKGLSPDGSKKLVQLQRAKGKKQHQAGWDLTFSAPKSVSVAWAVADEDLRQILQRCHDEAVRTTMEFMQDNLVFSRTGKGGTQLVHAAMIAAIFQHGTSRAGDPGFHSHVLFMNVGVSDGKTRTVLSKEIYQWKMTLGALYRSQLSHNIQRDTHLRVEADGFAFRIRGIGKAVVDLFSKRRQEIVALLGSKGQSSAKAAQIATFESRRPKDVKPRGELFSQWQKDAGRFGLTAWSLNHLRSGRPHKVNPYKLVDSSFRKLCGIKSTFTKSDLLRETALLGQVYGVSIDRLTRNVNNFIKRNPEIVTVAADRFTSKSNLKLESELLDMVTAEDSRNSRKHVVDISIVEKHLVNDRSLNWDQQMAVSHMTLAPGNVTLVTGYAGTGKSTAVKLASQIWTEAGYKVIGACISGKAAQELGEKAGIKTCTIAKMKQGFSKSLADCIWHHTKQLVRAARKKPTYRRGLPKLDSKTILVLDEAGMIGTRDLYEIQKEAFKAGTKLILSGDQQQIQPIELGTPFLSMLRRLGGVFISEIRRQKNAFDRQVVKDLSDGNARDALQSLKDRGRLHVCNSRDDAMKKMVADWGATNDRNDPMFAPTRVEVATLNKECQTLRLKNRELKTWETLHANGQKFYINDRIMFERTSDQFGVNNGDLGTTVQNTFVLLGGSMQDQHLAYVQLSRAEHTTHVYVDRFEAGDDLKGLEQSLTRSNPDLLARDYLDGQADQHHKKGFGYSL